MLTLQVVGGVTAGLVTGSLAGAAMTRWPEGRTLRWPRRSTCTGCGVPIAPRDLVPIVSYLLLRGRCRSCEGTIDPRIPLLELGTALLVAATVARYGSGLRGLLLAAVLAAVTAEADKAIDATRSIEMPPAASETIRYLPGAVMSTAAFCWASAAPANRIRNAINGLIETSPCVGYTVLGSLIKQRTTSTLVSILLAFGCSLSH
jgi:hypothetical protein